MAALGENGLLAALEGIDYDSEIDSSARLGKLFLEFGIIRRYQEYVDMNSEDQTERNELQDVLEEARELYRNGMSLTDIEIELSVVRKRSSFIVDAVMPYLWREEGREERLPEPKGGECRSGWLAVKLAAAGLAIILLAFPVGRIALVLTLATIVMGVGIFIGYGYLILVSFLECGIGLVVLLTAYAGHREVEVLRQWPRVSAAEWAIVSALLLTVGNALLTLYLWWWFWDRFNKSF